MRSPGWTVAIAVALAALPAAAQAAKRPSPSPGWPPPYITEAPPGIPKKCMGAAAMDPAKPNCARFRFVRGVVWPKDLDYARGEMIYEMYIPGTVCQGGDVNNSKRFPAVAHCLLGAPARTASRRIALVGDSHSAHWRAAWDAVGKKHNWSISSIYESACDFTVLDRYWGEDPQGCRAYRQQVPKWLKAHPRIDTAVMSSVAMQGAGELEAAERSWQTLPPTIKNIVSVRDNPVMLNQGCVQEVVGRGGSPGEECAMDRSVVLPYDASYEAALEMSRNNGRPGRHYYGVDLSYLACGPDKCYPVVGGLLVLASGAHQGPRWNLSLAPYLFKALKDQGFTARSDRR